MLKATIANVCFTS